MSQGSLLSLNNPMNLLREYSLGTSNTIISHHLWDNSICMTSTKLGIILTSSASFMSPLKEIKSKFLSTHLWYKSKWKKISFHSLKFFFLWKSILWETKMRYLFEIRWKPLSIIYNIPRSKERVSFLDLLFFKDLYRLKLLCYKIYQLSSPWIIRY